MGTALTGSCTDSPALLQRVWVGRWLRGALPLLLAFLSLASALQAQSDARLLSGRVVDRATGKPVPWTAVLHLQSGQGTVADSSGRFVLRARPGDSLLLRCVGYRPMRVQARDAADYTLQAADNLLSGLEVVAEDPYALKRLAGIRLPQQADSLPCYFHLESVVNRQAVEMLEAWYNGHFEGYDLHELRLKRGRIGLQPFALPDSVTTASNGPKRLFHSPETTEALNGLRLDHRDPRFPLLPFGRTRGNIRRRWWVTLQNRYRDPALGTMEVLAFDAVDPSQAFSGRVWIDSVHGHIWQLEASIQHAERHPFAPIAYTRQLENVQLALRRAYRPGPDGKPQFQQQHFDYSMQCISGTAGADTVRFPVRTRALLAAASRTKLFREPWFRFGKGSYMDYRNMDAAPPMPLFWQYPIGFSMPAYTAKTRTFLQDPRTLTGDAFMPGSPAAMQRPVLEHHYQPWSPEPFRLRASGPSSSARQTAERYPSRFFPDPRRPEVRKEEAPCRVGFQIYLDVLEGNDSVHYRSHTVFDPFSTQCPADPSQPLALDTALQWLVNIDFDLWELGRQKLMAELRRERVPASQAGARYAATRQALESQSDKLWNQTRRGRDRQAMLRWDAVVEHGLGRSHAAFFGAATAPGPRAGSSGR